LQSYALFLQNSKRSLKHTVIHLCFLNTKHTNTGSKS